MAALALLLGLATLAACGGTELEVSGPVPGQPPTSVVPIAPEDPPPTGTPDTIPSSTTTSSSSTTSTSSTTAPSPSSSSTTTPGSGDDPGSDPGSENPCPGGPAAPTSELQADPGAADCSVAFVNQRRAENGLGALTVDAELMADAEEWARQMATEQNMYHDPNRGEKMPDRYGWWGENVAMGPDPGGLDQAWWESEGHRANILGQDYDVVGIAFVQDANGTYWAVQIFGGDGS